MNESGVYIAVDLGASSGRVIAGALKDGKLTLEVLHRFENGPEEINGHFHWPLEHLKQGIAEGLKKAGAQYGDRLQSVGVDTWGVDYGLMDKNGELMGQPYAYRDSRTDGMEEKAEPLVSRREQYRINGLQFMFFNTLYQVLAEQLQTPERLQKADRILFMPDLFHHWLSGRQVNEYTIASTSALLEVESRTWSQDLLSKLNLPAHVFQDLIEPGTRVGPVRPELREELGLPDLQVVAPPGHDTAAAVAAVPFGHPDAAYLSSGTWSLMGIESPVPLAGDASYEHEFTNEGGVNGTYRVLKNICGLWILQECRRVWTERGEDIEFSDMVDLAKKAEPFQHFIHPDDPRFASPGDMEERIKAFCRDTGQAEPASRGALLRCIFESLALRYRSVLSMLEDLAGHEIPMLHIVGGGTQNKLLNQYTANSLGRRVTAGPVEATAAGNVLVQMIADGAVADVAEGRSLVAESFELLEYQPEDVDAWSSAYQTFTAVCSKL